MLSKALKATVLTLRFILSVLVAGYHTAVMILRHAFGLQEIPRPGFARITYPSMSDRGAALLACMTSLTPGSTVIDIDTEKNEMVVHLLNIDEAAGLDRQLRRDFEPDLCVICPSRRT